MQRIGFLVGVSAAILCASAQAQDVRQSRGVDASVDYVSLKRVGPWDDRNYALTAQDLEVLTKNEWALSEAIPAFYRVELRKAYPGLLREGKAQYPRSALPRFLIKYTGYEVDGKYYRDTKREQDRWVVFQSDAVDLAKEAAERALDGEARVTNPNGAAESSIEYNPLNPDIVIAGTNGPGGGQRMHFSSDGGETWNAAAALPLGGTCCDPTMDWSSDGSLAYAATLGNDVFVYRSSDNGQTWDDLASLPGNDPRREVSLGGFVDKEFLHVDRSPTSPFIDNIYLSWHEANILIVATSSDFGDTWSIVSSPSDGQFRGIGSDLTTDAAGTVYHFWPGFNSQSIWLSTSVDGGATFNTPTEIADTEGSFIFPVPSMDVREVFIYVSADVDMSDGPFADSIYAAWTDSTGPTSGTPANNHGRIQVAYSRDGGANWDITTPHSVEDAEDVDRYHQWLAVDDSGNVHVIYYDTQLDATRTSVDIYHSVSTDGAQTFSTPQRLTSESSPAINNGFEFGDYNGLSAAMDSIIAIYTDNRSESGGFGDSVDVYAAGAPIGNGSDSDGDGVDNAADNCIDEANPAQRDTNGDGYGNACDADLNDDCVVNVTDLGLLRLAFFDTGTALDADLNGDNVVNISDLGLLRSNFFGAPGPSGTSDVCD